MKLSYRQLKSRGGSLALVALLVSGAALAIAGCGSGENASKQSGGEVNSVSKKTDEELEREQEQAAIEEKLNLLAGNHDATLDWDTFCQKERNLGAFTIEIQDTLQSYVERSIVVVGYPIDVYRTGNGCRILLSAVPGKKCQENETYVDYRILFSLEADEEAANRFVQDVGSTSEDWIGYWAFVAIPVDIRLVFLRSHEAVADPSYIDPAEHSAPIDVNAEVYEGGFEPTVLVRARCPDFVYLGADWYW